MEGIKAFWLGFPIIERDGNVFTLETRKAVALLAYIGLTAPLPQSRENLATLFWPEYDQQHASANLRRSLYSINHQLGLHFIVGQRESVMVNPSCMFWQDVFEFRQLLDNVRSHKHERNISAECIGNLEKATALHRGSFLEGLNLRDAPDFDQWQYLQRAGFLQDLAVSLEQLALAYVSIGDWEKAIQKARHWVSLDQLDENAQRTLITCYAQAGQRSAALRQFEEYSRMLNDELGQSPDDESLAFYREIRDGKARRTALVPGISTPVSRVEPGQQPLIKTKLFIPRPRKDLVQRPQLLEKLATGSKNTLTLISAPAGYGKTTLLAEWIDFLQKAETSSPWAVCWFSLDTSDNDPIRFLAYLTAALEKVDLQVSAEPQEFTPSSDSFFPRTPLTILLNDLQELDQPVLLVLDDYQFIDNPAIHDGITFLLEHLPDNVHVVIATRSDPPFPLSRLRARGQLSEIRADDLRFRPIETARFLNQVFGLDLTQEEITKLENRTEGWIAGLQLAGVSMQGRVDIPQFIEAFSGSHRFIMDYLAEEALSRQPAEIQSYLLQTSILERLNDSLCDDVLRLNSKGQTTIRLATLENLGLFIVPLDDERVWYRYHHLFADLLHARLQDISPQLVPELHQRASIWFEKNGETESAIDHALAAADWDTASRLIELHMHRYLENGHMATVLKWAERFPQGELYKKPKLCVQVAEMYSQAGMIDQIDPLLDQAEELVTLVQDQRLIQRESTDFALSPEEITMIRSMILILRGLKAVCSGHPQHAVEITQAALETIPEMSLKELAVLYWVQGWAQRSLGNLDLALRLLTKGTEYATASGAILRDIWTDLGNVTRLIGRLPQSIDILESSLRAAIDRGVRDQGNLCRDESFLCFLYYELNQLDQAEKYAKRAVAHTQWWPSHNIIATANAGLAQILLARNDLEGCLAAIQKADEERKNRLMTPFVHSLVEVTWVQVWLKQRDWDLLDQWERNQLSILESKPVGGEKIDEYLELQLITLIRSWIERTILDKKTARYETSLSLLDRLETSSRSSGRANSLTVILLYKAIILFQKECRNEAFRALDDCFAFAEPGGYMRIFLDMGESGRELIDVYLQQAEVMHKKYALKIFKEFDNLRLTEKQKGVLPEMLTPREMNILQLLADGCSNREMAERLVLSEGTIKFHIHNILGKLGVTSRTQAIVKARHLNLL